MKAYRFLFYCFYVGNSSKSIYSSDGAAIVFMFGSTGCIVLWIQILLSYFIKGFFKNIAVLILIEIILSIILYFYTKSFFKKNKKRILEEFNLKPFFAWIIGFCWVIFTASLAALTAYYLQGK